METKTKAFMQSLKKIFMSRFIFLIGFLALWETVYYLKLWPPMLFPSVQTIVVSLYKNLINGELLVRTYYSLILIIDGMLIGIVLAAVLTALAMSSKTAKNFVNSIIAVMHPLPGIALLPLILLWFGLGKGPVIFIIVHSVLWPILLNTMSGFSSVTQLYRDFGMNIGLSKIGLIRGIYIPATLPNIYAGLKIGWARAWRALISAEMIAGATGKASGLGWYIYDKHSYLDVPAIFAAIVVIVLIGLIVEDVFFNQIEKHTTRKWGMES
jgi:NitT/TauT family transport system permease protein